MFFGGSVNSHDRHLIVYFKKIFHTLDSHDMHSNPLNSHTELTNFNIKMADNYSVVEMDTTER